MNLDFLSPDAIASGGGEAPIARSPMEASAALQGARFEIRDGWNVAVAYGPGTEPEAQAAARTAGWSDVSHLGKLELQASGPQLSAIVAACAGDELELGMATRVDQAWWCPLTPTRALVVCDPAARAPLYARLLDAAGEAQGASVVDVSTTFAALTLAGPLAREVLARFSAIDLRPQTTPVGALRPGSIARQPAILMCEAEDRYLFMFGWAVGEYMWAVVADAGHHLGGRAIGVDALARLRAGGDQFAPAREASRA